MSTELIIKYEEAFGCKIVANAKQFYLVYDKEYAYLPVKTRNADLMLILEQHVADVQKRITCDSTFSMTVKNVMIENYKKQAPTISSVSDSLAVSTRNLQRKLKEENTRIQDLLNEIKQNLADSYLKNNSLSITEISFMLGYAEPAVFTKAYKKWTGLTPEIARSKALV